MVFNTDVKMLGEKSTIILVSPLPDKELKEAFSHIELLINQFPGDYNELQKDVHRFMEYMKEVGCVVSIADEGMNHMVIFVYSHITRTRSFSAQYIIFRGEAEEIVIQSGNAPILFQPNPFANEYIRYRK